MTAMNMPVILGAVAQKPTTPAGEKPLPQEGSNSSFYKQLKQINLQQKNLSEKETTDTMDKGSGIEQNPAEQKVKAEDKPAGENDIQLIKQAEETSNGVSATNSEETVNNRIEIAFPAEENFSGKGVVEETETILSVSESFNQLLVPSTTMVSLPEQMDGQLTNSFELVSDGQVPAEISIKNEWVMSEIPILDQEDNSSMQMGTLVQGSGEPKSQTGDAKAISQVTQQQIRNNVSDLSTINGEQQISAGKTNIAPDQAARPDASNSALKVVRSNIQATSPIMGIENNAGQFLKDETSKDSTRLAEEVKQEVRFAQTAQTGEKDAKYAPEVKPLVKELLSPQSGNQKAQSESGAETKQNTDRDFTASSKTSPTTDVKKLINFETHRLNASRLSSEPAPVPEGQGKAVVDDGKAVLNTLSRSDTDLFRATTIADSSKNLPTAREIMAQIVQKTELLFTNKLSELKIDLKPEFLGRLTIKVMVEEGVVTARFIAENQQVKHMLESNLNTLRQNLESQGIRVERAEVSVQLNNGGMFDGSEGSRQYLWEEGQFSEGHQREGPYGDSRYTEGYEELDPAVAQGGMSYDYNENGNLNFLV